MATSLPSGTTFPRGFSREEKIVWPLVPARELFELRYGKALVASRRRPGDVPVYGTNGPCGAHDEALFEGPGVVLGRKGQGPLGVEWCDRDYWVIDTAYSLEPLCDDFDLKFAYYLIKYIGLNHLKDGTSNPSLSRDTFGAQALPWPPLEEQQAIAHILGTLDDKIDLNRRMSETLEAMARALFKSWFVDFNPVRAKIDGRWRRGQSLPGLPAHLYDLFPDRLVPSELGEIPAGWDVGPLAELAELTTKSIKPGAEPEAIWEHYSIPAYDDGQEPHRDLGETIKSGKYAVPVLAVLVSKLNPRFPRTWLPQVTDPARAICSTEFMPFVACKDHWRPFIYEMMKSYPVQDAIKAHATGSTGSRQRVKPNEIAGLGVIAPSPNVIDAFSDMTGPLHDRILLNQRQSRRLAGLRDTLLPKLLSGEIEPPEAEAIAEEVSS